MNKRQKKEVIQEKVRFLSDWRPRRIPVPGIHRNRNDKEEMGEIGQDAG